MALMIYLGIVQGKLVLWALEHPLTTTRRRNTHVNVTPTVPQHVYYSCAGNYIALQKDWDKT